MSLINGASTSSSEQEEMKSEVSIVPKTTSSPKISTLTTAPQATLTTSATNAASTSTSTSTQLATTPAAAAAPATSSVTFDLQNTFFDDNFVCSSSPAISPIQSSLKGNGAPSSKTPSNQVKSPALTKLENDNDDEGKKLIVPSSPSTSSSSEDTSIKKQLPSPLKAGTLQTSVSDQFAISPLYGTAPPATTSAHERRLNKLFQLAGIIETLLSQGNSSEYVQGLVADFRTLLDAHAEANGREEGKGEQGEQVKKNDEPNMDLTFEDHCEIAWGTFLIRIAQLKKNQVKGEGEGEKEVKLHLNNKAAASADLCPSAKTSQSWPPSKIAQHDGQTMTFPAFWKRFQLTLQSHFCQDHQDLDYQEAEAAKLQLLLAAVTLPDSVAIVADGCSSISEAELFLKRKYLSPRAIRGVIQEQLGQLKSIASKDDLKGLQALKTFLEEKVQPLVALMHVEKQAGEVGENLANLAGHGPLSKANEVAAIFDLLHNALPKSLGNQLATQMLGTDYSAAFLHRRTGPKKDLGLLAHFLDECLARMRKEAATTRGGPLVRRIVAALPKFLQQHFASNSELVEQKAKKAAVTAISKKMAEGKKAEVSGVGGGNRKKGKSSFSHSSNASKAKGERGCGGKMLLGFNSLKRRSFRRRPRRPKRVLKNSIGNSAVEPSILIEDVTDEGDEAVVLADRFRSVEVVEDDVSKDENQVKSSLCDFVVIPDPAAEKAVTEKVGMINEPKTDL